MPLCPTSRPRRSEAQGGRWEAQNRMNETNTVTVVGAKSLELLRADWPQLAIILGILLISGILGGLAGRYVGDKKEDNGPWYASTIIGVVAALITPLFLSMISSNLLIEWQAKPHLLFVIAGFALLAAVFGRRFLASMYDKVVKQVNDLKQEAGQLKAQTAELKTKIEVVEEANELPPTDAELPQGAKKEQLARENLEDEDVRLMEAMANSKFQSRSLSGLRRGTGVAGTDVHRRLSQLITRGLVQQHETKDNQPRWFLSQKGREMLGSLKS